MQIEASQNDNKVCISLEGVVDEKGAEELKKRIKQLPLDSIQEVEIDCSRVKHIGSSGIGKILLLYKHLASNGGKLRVVNLSGPLFELFSELKMDTLFSITRQS
ncbi:STAS domain-containing protein [Desulfurivibrio dismutans]|uniref:STAS domain-containing protein n=1 Tax=Desulfurivibrio dismutans TaxID=1398908 RepID=UPI0023DA2A62|nr:STAS domain-containing protein [Desulfurivibrio alkaliphilus]MDF1614473.1 STAS domain-containing protein [Desulfurivibrio alkaliphilus]